MAAMYARSNANSPRSPDQFTLERGQVSSPLPSATILREYSRDQLLDFIREARNQATSGASPKKISTNYKFLDEDANPRFAPSTIAQWLALPTAGLAGWIDAASHEHVTHRRHQDLVPVSDQHSTSSRTSSSALEAGGPPQEPAQARASTPAQADAISQRQLRGSAAVAAARAKVSAATLTAAKTAAAAAAARAAAAEAEATAAAAEAAVAAEEVDEMEAAAIAAAAGDMRVGVSDGAVAAAAAAASAEVEAEAESFAGLRSGLGSPRSGCFFSRPGSPAVAPDVDSLHRQIAKLQSALAAANTTTAPVHASSVSQTVVDALLQQNALLSARLAEMCRPAEPTMVAPPAPQPALKPFKDFLPNLPTYSGDDAPEGFLTQFRTHARHLGIPPELLPRQLIAKLRGEALTWFNLRFAGQDTTATLEEISLALRNDFGQEYAGARAFRDMWRVKMDFTLSGAQRLRVLNQLEERVRQLRVPFAPGPRECRYYFLLEAVSDSDSQRLFAEFTANPQCSEKALRRLEETMDSAGHSAGFGLSRDSLLAPPTPAREALFALRVELTEAFLQRIICPGSGGQRDRPARVLRTAGLSAEIAEPPSPAVDPGPALAPVTAQAASGPAPHATPAATAAECLVLTERLDAIQGKGFKGPPHYFGNNTDQDKKKRNMAEFSRRRSLGLCFKCTPSDLTNCQFLDCPRHGTAAVQSGAASRAASVRRAPNP
jgi:hypothetical protein